MKIKKKIVFILPNLNVGGAEKVSLLILNNLSNELFDKYLIVFSKKGKNLEKVNQNINIVDFKNLRLSSNLLKIYKFIKLNKIDVVFSTFYHINLYLCFLKLLLRFKLVIRESNDPTHFLKNGSKKKIVYYLYKFFYPLADRIILPAKYLKYRFVQMSMATSNVKVIYNPVVDNKNNLILKRNIFCAIGRLTFQKGFDKLIKIVNKSNLEKLYIIGKGKEKKKLIKISNSKKIKFINETNPTRFLLKSRGLFFSSRWEGMPNILLEALMCGTKIISISKIDSIIELKKISKRNSIYFTNEKNFNLSIK